jgi:hypothetical protein
MQKGSLPKKLLAFWKLQGFTKLQKGIEKSEIKAFEFETSLLIPADMLDYLSCANGFQLSDEFDALEENGFEFLPLTKDNLRFGKYFVFCRWPYALLEYAICLDESKRNGEVFMLGDDSYGHFLSMSFSEFLEFYLVNAPILYNPNSKRMRLD